MTFDTIEYIEKRVAAGNDLSPKHGEILLAEIEALKVQACNFRDVAKENRELVDLVAKVEIQRDEAIKLLQKHGIHLASKECWCNPTVEKDCFQPPKDLKKIYASIGGKLGKRKISPEQQAKMQAARKRKVI